MDEEGEEISSQSDTLEDNIMHDVEPLDRKELIIEDIHLSMDTIQPPSPLPLSTSVTSQQEEKSPTKCRLPLPSFSVDQRKSAAIPVNEKIANVIRKRQTMTDANRSQGSRIPMLCILQHQEEEVIEVKTPKLRSVKSVRLPQQQPQQKKSLSGNTNENTRIKTLSRSNTVPSRMDQQLKPKADSTKTSNKRASTRSPLNDISKTNVRKPKIAPVTPPVKQKKELPPKSSIYRHKRLPAGESRTARLMMGVSTNGRRQSFRQREEIEKETSPTLGHRFGKLFNKKEPPQLSPLPTITTPNTKRRPMSFAASSSSMPKYSSSPDNMKTIPPTTPRTRRQSVPVPPSSEDSNNNKKKPNHGIKNSIKVLRVH